MSFIHRLLSAGYFPKELPPPFTTVPLADFATANPGYYSDPWKSYRTKLVRHHLAQLGRNRRVLSIPNPINQIRLVKVLEQHQAAVFRTAAGSKISASVPKYAQTGPRSIQPRNYNFLPIKRARARAVASYLLRTDVSRFFHSIYTHSIPWALHTKPVAKSNRGRTLYGNVIDKCVREAQDGQTIGLPVGPDTSWLIAEVVLCAVDRIALDGVEGYRWVDDYEISGVSKGDCQSHLAELEAALAEFELALNISKTSISELPTSLQETWIDYLKRFSFATSSTKQRDDIITFFSRAFDFARDNDAKPVLRWAVRRLHGLAVARPNWRLVQDLMWQAAVHEPEVLPHVLAVLNFYELQGYPLNRKQIEAGLSSIAKRYAARKLGSEVGWAIWGFLQFGIDVPLEITASAQTLEDDVVALLLLDAERRGLTRGVQVASSYSKIVEGDAFESEHWLLAYEGIRKGWLAPGVQNEAAFRQNSHVTELLAADVYFYDDQWAASATARHVYGTPNWIWYDPELNDALEPSTPGAEIDQ